MGAATSGDGSFGSVERREPWARREEPDLIGVEDGGRNQYSINKLGCVFVFCSSRGSLTRFGYVVTISAISCLGFSMR
jgi:hypothetical protein